MSTVSAPLSRRTEPIPVADKPAFYERLLSQARALIRGLDDDVAVQASISSLLYHSLPQPSWVGFYRVVEPELLRVGPYQGPLGCLEIPFGQGVCGTAARHRASQLVPDVEAFPGHIACDPTSRSEVVVPVDDRKGRLTAVLDLDSRELAAFDAADLAGLERLAALLSGHLRGSD